jgi:transposase
MQVGWDWASETHDVTVMDTAGQVVDRWSLTHDEAGLDRAIGRLARHGHPRSAAGCDRDHQRRGRGPAVGRRSPGDTGAPQCVQCHPGTVGAARAKSDPGDSWKLADLLRTDGHRLHRLRPLDAAIRHLQVLARLRDDHLEAKTAATNQLGALLDAHWPGTKAIFARLDSPIALAFLERYPTPQAAQRLGQGRLATFCRRHAYSGHRTPAELLTRLRSAPVASTAWTPRCWPPASLPRSSCCALCWPPSPTWTECCAPPCARTPRPPCWRPCRASARSTWPRSWPRSVPSWTAPATPNTPPLRPGQPGHQTVGQGHLGPLPLGTRARNALATYADNSRHASPVGRHAVPPGPPARPASPSGVRILMRAWLRVMWACWHANTPYQVNRHGAERRLADQSAGQG